jgi:hypothetical protein
MKYFILFVLILVSTSGFSKIWRINNNAGVVADHTTAQAAHDAAAVNDTLMFEPSGTSYGNLILAKTLTVFGVGYFLSNSNPNSPITTGSTLGSVTFNVGSTGSVMTGITLASTTTINTSNITIKGNNYAGGQITVSTSASNVVIIRNFNVYIDVNGAASNVIISNNFLNGLDVNATQVGVIVTYNVIKASFTVAGQTFSNNIFCNGSSATLTSSTVSNNIDARVTPSAVFGTSNGNLGNISPLIVFVGGSVSGSSFSVAFDGDLVLKTGSPAIGAGIGGEDCGMFGGSNPYALSGLPPIPLLTKFVSSGIGSDTTPVQITISAQSSN